MDTCDVALQMEAVKASSITKYACKKCRRLLFTDKDLAPHQPKQHHIAARKKLKDLKHHVSAHMACSSYFLKETVPWMDEGMLAEDKIHCITQRCQSRLGALQWSGSQCSCGTWVTPSIKITKSRVDAQSNLNTVTRVMVSDSADAKLPERFSEYQ